MTVTVTDAQRALPVDVGRMARMARAAVKRLRLRGTGCLAITFVSGARMRALNRRFLGHDRSTDVLSFRYADAAPRSGAPRASSGLHLRRPSTRFARSGRPLTSLGATSRAKPLDFARGESRGRRDAQIVGDIVIAPSEARAYAARHQLSYEEELSRYVVHGLLHWLGHEDATPAQRRRMRALEDTLLTRGRLGRAHTNGHPHH
jgi:probable rRNA maturation factor